VITLFVFEGETVDKVFIQMKYCEKTEKIINLVLSIFSKLGKRKD